MESWRFMESHGIMEGHGVMESPWRFSERHGNSWTVIESHREPWRVMESHRIMESHGSIHSTIDSTDLSESPHVDNARFVVVRESLSTPLEWLDNVNTGWTIDLFFDIWNRPNFLWDYCIITYQNVLHQKFQLSESFVSMSVESDSTCSGSTLWCSSRSSRPYSKSSPSSRSWSSRSDSPSTSSSSLG